MPMRWHPRMLAETGVWAALVVGGRCYWHQSRRRLAGYEPWCALCRAGFHGKNGLRELLKGVLGDHLHVPKQALGARVFPESGIVRPIFDIIRH
jgi:hypothetical protein